MASLDEQFKQLLKSEIDYPLQSQNFIPHLLKSDEESVKYNRKIFKTIAVQFTGQKKVATRLFLSLLLVKDLMEIDSNKFAEATATDILPNIVSIFLFNNTESQLERIRRIFGEKTVENEQETTIAGKFFQLCLESVFIWSQQLKSPFYKEFKEAYTTLESANIRFPTEFTFFNHPSVIGSHKEIHQSQLKASTSTKQPPQQQQKQKYGSELESFLGEFQETLKGFNAGKKSSKLIQELLPFQDALVFFISQIQEDINGLIAEESPSTETEAALEKAFDFQQKFETLQADINNLKSGSLSQAEMLAKYLPKHQQNTFDDEYGNNKSGQQKGTPTPNEQFQLDHHNNENNPNTNNVVYDDSAMESHQFQLNYHAQLNDGIQPYDEYPNHSAQKQNANQVPFSSQIQLDQQQNEFEDHKEHSNQFEHNNNLHYDSQLKQQSSVKQASQKQLESSVHQQKESSIKPQSQMQIHSNTQKEEFSDYASQKQKSEQQVSQLKQSQASKLTEQQQNEQLYLQQQQYEQQYLQQQQLLQQQQQQQYQQQQQQQQIDILPYRKDNNQYQQYQEQQKPQSQNQLYQQGSDLRQNSESNIGYLKDSNSENGAAGLKQRSQLSNVKSTSAFSKVINESMGKYILPYQNSKVGINQSTANAIDYRSDLRSSGGQNQLERKLPQFSEKLKLKELKSENELLQKEVQKLSENLQLLQSSQDVNNQVFNYFQKKLIIIFSPNNSNNHFHIFIFSLSLQDNVASDSKRLHEQDELILDLKKQLNKQLEQNATLKQQRQSVNNQESEMESLKVQISKLQQQLSERSSMVASSSEHFDQHQNNPHQHSQQQQQQQQQQQLQFSSEIESHPEYRSLLKQNEELREKLALIDRSGIHQQHQVQQNTSVINPNNDSLQNQQHDTSKRRLKSPKIFQEFRSRGAQESQLRQSMAGVDVQAIQLSNNANQNTFKTATNRQSLNIVRNSQPFSVATDNNRLDNNKDHPYQLSQNQMKGSRPIFDSPSKPTISAAAQQRVNYPIYNNNNNNNNNNILGGINYQDEVEAYVGRSEPKANNHNNLNHHNPQFNSPPSGDSRIHNRESSNNKPFEVTDMKELSPVLYNEKREEIESIPKNNQSSNSYNEQLKEILQPLQWKNQNATEQQPRQSVPVQSALDENRQIDFQELVKGDRIEFDAKHFTTVTQYVSKVNRFKAACLKPKYPLQEDSQLQIGVVTSHSQSPQGNYFRFQLYFANKSARSIKNLKVTVLDNSRVHISPEIVQEIEAKQQKKMELVLEYSQIPFEPCFISVNYSGASPLYLALPNTVNKLFVYRDVNREAFKNTFNSRKHTKYIQIAECSQKFAKTHQDFKLYLEKLVDLNPEREFDHISGSSKFKMGLQFTLDLFNQSKSADSDYLVKIVCNPDTSVNVFIAYNDLSQSEKAVFILNTFCYLFSANSE